MWQMDLSFVNPFRKKRAEEDMSKRVVKLRKTDGKTPTRHGPSKCFNLRAPLRVVVPANCPSLKVTMGLSFEAPIHVFGANSVKGYGVSLVDGVWAMHDTGQDVVLYLKNESKEDVIFEEGETMARCVVIDNSDVELK